MGFMSVSACFIKVRRSGGMWDPQYIVQPEEAAGYDLTSQTQDNTKRYGQKKSTIRAEDPAEEIRRREFRDRGIYAIG